MNQEKLSKMQAQVRIGGKGTARRKKKVVHRTNTTDDKKLQSSLKKLAVSSIPGIEEVNMIKEDGTVIHFNNPKVQASLAANTFAVSGHGENKQITEMLPGILNQLGPEGITHLKRLATVASSSSPSGLGALGAAGGASGSTRNQHDDDDDDDVPELVDNFDEPSKGEAATVSKSKEKKEDEKKTEDKKGGEGKSKAKVEEVKAKVEEIKAEVPKAAAKAEVPKAAAPKAKDGAKKEE